MRKINIFISVIPLFLLCIFIVIFTINQNVFFKLNGEEEITIEVNSNYVDEGYVARVFNNDLSKYVQVKNKVDTGKVGTYIINYYLSYMGKINMLTRTVIVVEE